MNQRDTSILEILRPEAHADYILRGKREIAQILSGLIDKHALLAVHVRGTSFMSAILAANPDDGYIVLDASPEDRLNQLAIGAEQVICSSMLDKVKVQFPAREVMPWQQGPHRALRADFPDMLLRLQRRAYFRLPAPTADGLACTLPIVDATGKLRRHAARVLDISGGGIGMLVPPRDVELSPGMKIDHCTLELPDAGPITFTLHIRNLFQVNARTGHNMLRAGCEFLNLSNQSANLIQRYILKIERERKAKELGL